MREPTEEFVPIQTVGGGAFWVRHSGRLRARAQGIAADSKTSEEDAYRALILAAAAEQTADGFVIPGPWELWL